MARCTSLARSCCCARVRPPLRSALPAACTEFLFGDCVPFLKREAPVTCQQIFSALPAREELQYSLASDETPYKARHKSRFDTPDMTIVFGDTLAPDQAGLTSIARPRVDTTDSHEPSIPGAR